MSSSFSVTEAINGGYITGLKTGEILPRLEIDEFSLDKDVLNLFLQALENLQNLDFENPWSWFQISGIHGQPSTPWDHVEGAKPGNQRSHYAGYCSHSSITFPTWHRPYVAMMEQAVYDQMVTIASQYTEPTVKKRYQGACARFRFPYWDPCIPRHLNDTPFDISAGSELSTQEFGIPMIVSRRKVYVRRPRAPEQLVEMDNPLFQYNFPDAFHSPHNPDYFWSVAGDNTLIDDPSMPGTWHTVRSPNSSGQTDDSYCNNFISSHIHGNVGSSFYKILTTPQPWATFSNDVFDSKAAAEAGGKPHTDHTLEGFHDNIHGWVGQGKLRGGSGHMAFPQYAAFDPIFWLHHCNVDRITALWQAQRGLDDRNSWWTAKPAGEANRAVEMGASLTPDDPLVPFRRSRRNPSHEDLYTSQSIRRWTDLGYTYLVKRVVRNQSTGRNELDSSLLTLDHAGSPVYNVYFNQFYGWLDVPESTYPELIRQFYPIDLSQVEALTGRLTDTSHPVVNISTATISEPSAAITPVTVSPPSMEGGLTIRLPSYPERLQNRPPPPTDTVDYGYISNFLGQRNEFRQWELHIVAEKFRLKKSYQILVFIGPFNDQNPDSWPEDKYLVGIDAIFSNNPHAGNCENCEQQAASKLCVMDVISLTHHLVKWIRSRSRCPDDDGGLVLEDLSYEQVSRFLAKNLHWRVADMNLCPYREEVDFVKVSAVDRIVKLPGRYDESVIYEGSEYRHDVHGYGEARGGGQYDGGYEKQDDGYGNRERDGGETQPRYDGDREGDEGKCCGMRCVAM